MAKIESANANPEKRLFISLITRDIGLTDAIIDLMDNSVNAAMKPLRNSFNSPQDFHRLFESKPRSIVTIKVTYDGSEVAVVDDAAGIDFESARDEVFRFGHPADHRNTRDRLSVYGIGMKRAVFKIGNEISISSDHERGGFDLKLNVKRWAGDTSTNWQFPISRRASTSRRTGTSVAIRNLHKEIRARINDGRFESDLREKISKVYSYFLGRIVNVIVNGKAVVGTSFEIGSNFSHEKFSSGGVDCSIIAGIASATGDKFIADTAGWFVFCNFRTVIYADKTPVTGWGDRLPLFQPKHRPFIGLVFLTSPDPELLPWTTTKGALNEDNLVWQDAKLRMASVAKPVIKFLDTRYSSEGTEVEPDRVAKLSGAKESVFEATISRQRSFSANVLTAPKETKVQYFAKEGELEKVRKHFGRARMSASEIGRKTFDFFLKNEVG